jgi:dihydroorotate dehydrogenase
MVVSLLAQHPDLEPQTRVALAEDYDSFARGLPRPLEDFLRERYDVDLSSEYGGLPIKNPFGKASGQLSLNLSQVRRDAEAGLGFAVLKTLIAQDAGGGQSMRAWAIPVTRMLVEPIRGADGSSGWTVTWKGRGWSESFEAYLQLFAESLAVYRETGMVVAPSCKFHLPGPKEDAWRLGEYEYTTGRLLDVWQKHIPGVSMPIEKDFSPTLAGSDLATQKNTVLRWLSAVTRLIRQAAHARPVTIGVKLFNAMFEDSFQLEIFRVVNESGNEHPDFLVYANRLFDPNREFDGKQGVAYGGPDLSARNLAVLARVRSLEQRGEIPASCVPISATGNIESGRTAIEYLVRGASSFQIHTYFQLPDSSYSMRQGNKTERALHELYFHPDTGLIAWLLHLRRVFDWPKGWNVKAMAEFCADPANRLWADYGQPALRT